MEFAPLVRIGTIYPFLKVLRQAGCQIDRYLENCGLIRQVHEYGPEQFVPFVCVLNFLEATSRSESMENLGFLAGSQTEFSELGQYGWLVMQQPTVFHAIKLSDKLVGSYNTSVSSWTADEGADLRCYRHFSLPSQVGLSQAEQFTQMVILNTYSTIAGGQWRPAEIQFQSQAPLSFPLEAEIGSSVVFGQKYNSMVIPRSLAARPLRPVGQSSGNATLEDRCHAPDSPIKSLRCIIESLLLEGCLNINITAEAAGMSVRTLQRRLKLQGQTFSKLMDDVRFGRATFLMKDPDAKMIEIALDLGYQNPGNFTRAFRRWSGFSPQEFRALNYRIGIEESGAQQ